MKLFRLKDFLIYGGLAMVATLTGLKAIDYNDLWTSVEALKIMIVPLLFWATYGAILVLRNRVKKSIWHTSPEGVHLRLGDFKSSEIGGARKVQFDRIISTSVEAWDLVFPDVSVKGVVVTLKKLPFTVRGSGPGLLAGYTFPYKRSILVGLEIGVPLQKSALAHELSHQILWDNGEVPTETTLLVFNELYGTPV